MSTKFLITGATGFVGQWLDKRLRENGHNVRHFDRRDSRATNADVIFHCAAEVKDESKMLESNILLTYFLLHDNPQATFIYIGSSSEYGRKDHKMSESDGLVPTDLYEATKGCGSLLCQAFAKKQRVLIARPFSLYGPNEKPKRFFPTIMRKYFQKEPLNVYRGVHDWIYISDFIDGLMLLYEKGTSGDIVNFGSGISTPNFGVLKKFEKVLGDKIDYVFIDEFMRQYDSYDWCCDTTKAKENYGFECKVSLEEGIGRFIAHEKQVNANWAKKTS
jgi:nucleoside-diphosphate-sugar epimerase